MRDFFSCFNWNDRLSISLGFKHTWCGILCNLRGFPYFALWKSDYGCSNMFMGFFFSPSFLVIVFIQRSFLLIKSARLCPLCMWLTGGTCPDVGFSHWSHWVRMGVLPQCAGFQSASRLRSSGNHKHRSTLSGSSVIYGVLVNFGEGHWDESSPDWKCRPLTLSDRCTSSWLPGQWWLPDKRCLLEATEPESF